MKLTNAILELIKESSNPLSRREIAYISNCSEVAVSRSLKELLDKGQIVNIGTGRQVRYGVEQNIPMYQTNVYVTDFKKIKNANELISYLCNTNDRLKNTSSLCQYTNLNAVLNIIPESVKLIVFICQSTIRLAKSRKCTLIMLNKPVLM